MKILTQIHQQNLDCWMELIKIGISTHRRFSSDSIEIKLTTTIRGGFYFVMGCNKQVK